MYLYNWITMLCTWNILSQLYFNKKYIYFKKDDKSCDIRKLGWVPYEQYLYITLRDSDWYGTNWVRWPEVHWVHLIELSEFVVLIYDPDFHQDG